MWQWSISEDPIEEVRQLLAQLNRPVILFKEQINSMQQFERDSIVQPRTVLGTKRVFPAMPRKAERREGKYRSSERSLDL